jgi:tRNA threonylcarbamoyladenosine biosynthesis protein TsaB
LPPRSNMGIDMESIGPLLAIDTATEMVSIALYGEAGLLAEDTWRSAGAHTVELMPGLVRMLDRASLPARALGGLAVALGPGSFTGLRTGLAVAKGLAMALSLPLIGVPTLDALAYALSEQPLPVCAVLQAGRGRLCVTSYGLRQGRWQRTSDYLLVTPETLGQGIEERTLFCGELDPATVESLRQRTGDLAAIALPAFALRRAGYLAEIAWQRLVQGDVDDPVRLSPIYLQHPEVKWP